MTEAEVKLARKSVRVDARVWSRVTDKGHSIGNFATFRKQQDDSASSTFGNLGLYDYLETFDMAEHTHCETISSGIKHH
jgi:hypothetical protein